MTILRYEVQRTEFFIILGHFLPFYAPNDVENQNFEKMKKTPTDIITLLMCTINNSPEIWRATDKICYHFGPFFVLVHAYLKK